jgi:hypothetical protein
MSQPPTPADYREAAKHFRDVPHYAAAFELAADIIEWGLSDPPEARGLKALERRVNADLLQAIRAFVDKLAAQPSVTDEEFFDSFAGIAGETVSE